MNFSGLTNGRGAKNLRFYHGKIPRVLVACASRIRLICTDVDGTLLNSKQELTPVVKEAVLAAARIGVQTMVATGKAKGPWASRVLPQLEQNLPGVFLQGLRIYGPDGVTVLHDQCLPESVVEQCIQLAMQRGITLAAYCGERIFCDKVDEHTERLVFYQEPTPEAVGSLQQHLQGKIAVNKLIFMAPETEIQKLRPVATAELQDQAALTTALSGMLEVLPLGASKAEGMLKVLSTLGIDCSEVMALGDGENDLEMLEMAGTAVAMGNAGAAIQAVADFVAPSNDEDGVAVAIERFVLQRVESTT